MAKKLVGEEFSTVWSGGCRIPWRGKTAKKVSIPWKIRKTVETWQRLITPWRDKSVRKKGYEASVLQTAQRDFLCLSKIRLRRNRNL
jgi:hypothetical protein